MERKRKNIINSRLKRKMFKKGGVLNKTISREKAQEMLNDGEIKGKALTEKQKSYFRDISDEKFETGGEMKKNPKPEFKKQGTPLIKFIRQNSPKEANHQVVYHPIYKQFGWLNDKGLENNELPIRLRVSHSPNHKLGVGTLFNVFDLVLIPQVKTQHTYEHGGYLDKEFKFDKNFVVYVPSTSDVSDSISKKQMNRRVKEVETYVANAFGGFTETETDGGYKANDGSIVEEEVVKVSVFSSKEDWEKKENEVVLQVKKWANEWGQEAIGFEYEGDLYYIDREGKFAEGGKTFGKPEMRVEQFVDEDTGELEFFEIPVKDENARTDSPSYNRRARKIHQKRKRKFDRQLNLRSEIRYLDEELVNISQTLNDILFGMEQQAEPEGGEVCTLYGERLEKAQKRKIAIEQLIDKRKKELDNIENLIDTMDDDY